MNNNIQERLYEDQTAWAQQVVNLAKSNLIRGKKIAAGTLYNSISYKIDKVGQIEFLMDESGQYVESGRRRGARMPPPDKIAQWARVKGLPRFRDKKGRYISNDSRAFLLARSISVKGIKAYPFFSDALEESLSKLGPMLENTLEETFEQQMDELLEI
jgi:hypothetical protein